MLEDTVELQCVAEDHVPLRTKPGVVSMAELVRSTLRLRPDRIVVGEVRGGEALDLLKAWGTGHPGGIATIHAGSALGALTRLEQLIQEVVVTVPRALIAETVERHRLHRRPRSCAPGRGHRAGERSAVRAGIDFLGFQLRQEKRHDAESIRRQSHSKRLARLSGRPRRNLAGALPALAAGSNMPWEAPLQSILDSIQGPVAQIVAVIIIIVTGLTLAFGDTSGGFRKLIQIVFGLSIAFAASSFFLDLLQLRRRRGGRMSEAPLPDGFEVPLHRSLTEPIFLGGAPRSVAIVNGTLAAAVGIGLQLWLVGIALGLVGHALAVWGAKADPQFMEVFARHLKHKRSWSLERC